MPKILNKADLAAAFDLPFEEAIEFLEKKGYQITFNWREMLEGAHKRAFTIAGVLKLDVLQTTLESLQTAADEGKSMKQWREEIESDLQSSGYLGGREETDPVTGQTKVVQLTPHRLENIYRTNLQSAYNAARREQQMSFAGKRPYLQYLSTIDDRTTTTCQGLNGQIFAANDPIWDRLYPPNHFRCRARVASASARELKRGLPIRNVDGSTSRVSEVSDGKQWRDYEVGEGFAAAPDMEWKPDMSAYDNALRLQFDRDVEKNT